MDALLELMKREPPEVLFHYRSQNGFMGIIRDKHLFATSIHYLNDAAEFAYPIELARRELHKRMIACKFSEDSAFYNELLELLTSISQVNIFVCSFSESGDQLSQWRGYCPTGNGFSIGFSSSELKKYAASHCLTMLPCVYDKKYQELIIDRLINIAYQGFKDCQKTEPEWYQNHMSRDSNLPVRTMVVPPQHPAAKGFEMMFLTFGTALKHPSFHEEKEWRLVTQLEHIQNFKVKYRPGASMITPYVELNIGMEQSKMENMGIKQIYIGPTPHPELAARSTKNFLFAHLDNTNWKISPSQIPYRGW